MSNVGGYMDDLYLEHHGVKGQKWGVRRYQNSDSKAKRERWKGPDTLRYRYLNRKADRGDRLRARGETVTSAGAKYANVRAGLLIGGAFSGVLMSGKNISLRYGDTRLGNINSRTIQRGSSIASGVLALKTFKDQSDIRTSYRRERNGKYWAG